MPHSQTSDNRHVDIEKVSDLYLTTFAAMPDRITPLAGAGSNRRYYRVDKDGLRPIVATCGDDPAENLAFINLSYHFADVCGLPVPQILASSEDTLTYLQTWAGDESLFDRLASARQTGDYSDDDMSLLKQAVRLLARIQFAGGANLDYSVCHPGREMDSRLVMWDLNYFKYSFLKPSGIEFDESLLQNEFDQLEDILLKEHGSWTTFMVRDYQSRNLMVDEAGNLTAIDFQGGRRGPCAYDVASFLWQAKARYPRQVKNILIEAYADEAVRQSPLFDKQQFLAELPMFVLFRCLQTLGAYGFRGWVEHKPHFLQSIPAGVDNLAELMSDPLLSRKFPVIAGLSVLLQGKYGAAAESTRLNELRHHITPSGNPLTVAVTSFSFKKGIPEDPTGNGGGFVFDCRAPHNPGRYEPYKKLTGLDKPVRDFLERDGEIAPFIKECQKIVDASVERYLQRGFSNLAVNFGCTGGQHRSVYSADAVARHINEKYGVKVVVTHREQCIAYDLPPKEVKVIFDSYLRYPQKPYNQPTE